MDYIRTKDRLLNWGITIDTACLFCQDYLETRDHLYFKCAITNRIGKAILDWQSWTVSLRNGVVYVAGWRREPKVNITEGSS